MKRLALLLIATLIALAACRSPEEAALWETVTTHWATQTAPTPSPLPLTATVKAYLDNQWATALAPTPAPGPATTISLTAEAILDAEQRRQNVLTAGRYLDLTRTPIVTPNPATVTAVIATTEAYKKDQTRATVEAAFWDRNSQFVLVTVTPEPLPSPVPAGTCSPFPPGFKLDLNTASVTDLMILPASVTCSVLGFTRAEALFLWLHARPAIINLSELDAAPGIGPGIITALRGCSCTTQD